MPAKSSRTVSTVRSLAATRLQHNLERNLLAYAVVAGTSLLSLANPAEAQIVYTPSNIPITEQNHVLTQLDLNNDGTPDFAFSNYSYRGSHTFRFFLKVVPDQAANEIWGVKIAGQKRVSAAALPEGTKVGSNGNFKSDAGGLFMAASIQGFSTRTVSGSWNKLETAYLGLKFVVSGEVHYGWARIKFVSPGRFATGSISGYAYEATPNAPIVTGQTSGTAENAKEYKPAANHPLEAAPSSLGMLAAGSSGFAKRSGQPNTGARNTAAN